MTTRPAGVPNITAPMVDGNGRLTQPWLQFLVALAAGVAHGGTIDFATAIPTAGTFARGSVLFNSNAAVGQPKGWRCTVAGTPGTWVSEGNL